MIEQVILLLYLYYWLGATIVLTSCPRGNEVLMSGNRWSLFFYHRVDRSSDLLIASWLFKSLNVAFLYMGE